MKKLYLCANQIITDVMALNTDKNLKLYYSIKEVYNLVKVRGFKLAAARKMLRENKQGVDHNTRVMEGLMKVRDDLKALKKQLDYLT